MNPEPLAPSEAAWTAAERLRVDQLSAEVLLAFRTTGVQVVLLKGPSIARWLYGAGDLRPYLDSDFLVRPSDATAAGRVLADMGYAPEFDGGRMPGWWDQHATSWLNPGHGPVVDLHWSLQGVHVHPGRAWEVLSQHTETLEVAGVAATVLSVPARTLYLALTAAHDGPRGRVAADLERALEKVSDDTWRRAAELAVDLDATDWFVAGLLQRPEGEALAARLGLESSRSVETALRRVGAPREALTIDQIAQASGPWQSVEIVIRKLFPPVTYMRHWSGLASRGLLGLGLAYGYRVLWVIGKAGPALAAWWRARRHVTARLD